MENNSDAKQLIIDRVKQATNILVTVENNPSVDELAAALALTLMLNKLDKHATAVFSGAVPPAINFLEPGKTFENTVDSLRDFIIALDKEKADRLRYKVEDDVVKIFITPYQSTITEKDLRFSQGDFNVEVVMALGVEKRESLDRAIAAHGRILHDATVITINARDEHSNLGAIDWQDGKASAICEMLVSLGEALQPKMLDAQISTALLTGIVAATDRFSNERTTPHSMTLAAELMAAGANQQLIANNLQPPAPKAEKPAEEANGKISREPVKKEGDLSEESKKLEKPSEPPTDGSKGEMKVRHEEPEEEKKEEAPAALPVVAPEPELTPEPAPAEEDKGAAAIPTGADELSGLKDAVQSAAANPPMPLSPTSASPTQEQAKNAPQQAPVLEELTTPKITPLGQNLESNHKANWDRLEPPTLGGTLNATSAEAEEARRREAEEESKHNHVTLNHGGGHIDGSGLPSRTVLPPEPRTPTDYIAAPTPPPSPVAMPQPPAPAPAPVSPVPAPTSNPSLPPLPPIQQQPALGPTTPPPVPTPPVPTREETEKKQSIKDLEDARKAVSDALGEQPFNAANQPLAGVGAQPMQNDTPPPPPPSVPPQAPAAAPMAASPTPPPMPAPTPGGLPPLPDFNTLPPLPPLPGTPGAGNPMQTQTIAPGTDVTAQFAPPAPSGPTATGGTPLPPIQAPPAAPAPGQVSANPNDPNQFRIPGQ